MEKLNKHFFEVLNPAALPETYGNALNKGDRKTAMEAAVKYFRERPVPAGLQDLRTQPFDMEIAEKAVQDYVTVVNFPYQFPDGKIDFLYDPTLFSTAYNPEWQWQLNRMRFWNDMALAYHNTQDEKFAAAFAQQVHTWVTEIPCPAEDWNGRKSAWRSIETGLRLMGSWKTAFEIFRSSPSVPSETLALMLASMHEQTLHAWNNRTSQNWLLMELNGAYTFAVLFPEFKDAQEIRLKTSALLSQELKKQLLPDGMQNELSPDYHSVTFNCAAMMYDNARHGGFLDELPEDYAELLTRAADSYLQLVTPGFTQPRSNDCFTIPTPEYMKKAYELFPDRQDFLWGATSGKEGTPPEGKTASRFMPWAGFAVMRSNWDTDAAYLNFDVGPLGRAHIHQDKLNINIYKGGEELLFDDGGGQYEESDYRRYGLSAYDHNTVLVDGLAQSRQEPKQVEQEIDADFISNEKFDYARGIYDDTFGAELLKPAVHQREVLFVKPDFFVVSDTLKAVDGKPHDYTMLLHMDTLNVKTAPGVIHGVFNGKYDLYAVLLSKNVEIKTESGQNAPVSGWFVGRNAETLHPATTVKVTAAAKENFNFVTLFFPLAKDAVPPAIGKLFDGQWVISFNGRQYQLDLNELKNNL